MNKSPDTLRRIGAFSTILDKEKEKKKRKRAGISACSVFLLVEDVSAFDITKTVIGGAVTVEVALTASDNVRNSDALNFQISLFKFHSDSPHVKDSMLN